MTRTLHNEYPRAVRTLFIYQIIVTRLTYLTEKDRHESRNGLLNKTTKDGAGPHAWGSYEEEVNHYELGVRDTKEALQKRGSITNVSDNGLVPRRTSNVSIQERENARKERSSFSSRKSDGLLDLSAIARSSAAGSTNAAQD
ncbi:hypothetical protein E3Q17_03547 [Wallemia mellicola]|uniref:Hyaluronan/mRNA-binding protein domain-containing protein n=1 Tax=Wallemia mellicola TaxID=1708541 RepID=A0A4T0P0C7_9BASI|nr:hypothetical protein E3Q24_03296 [Wallemia mellicola]TIB83102.1 hypothetical protein E3Q21_03089 [Wallemia mellicola]TIB85837.1 hypothetical protein E3Q20_03080 [Wallemia mellicola]TIB97126.1 hypothetical protein E3Q17_03547 [Wallemia mellicola]TIC03385.1 hypothetical protein E3Q16_03075 [Wallemia mellicola]